MHGLMMDVPLTVTRILERARRYFPDSEILTRTSTGYHRYRFAEFAERVARLAGALVDMGVRPGDRVGTFAWNHHRHMELYFAVPCIGAVLHTVNVRLAEDQVLYIITHAQDRVVFVDDSLVSTLAPLADRLNSVERFVVMGDAPATSGLPNATPYEELLAAARPLETWPELDERTACVLCYTSGTTGTPKGVLYSHRAMVLHSLSLTATDVIGLSQRDRVLTIVPLYHANAWGIPFAATMVGAAQVLPGQHLQPAEIVDMIAGQRITYAGGVPTIWLGVLEQLEGDEHDLSSLTRASTGGSAVPSWLIEAYARRGVTLLQGWGMTETGPLATLSTVKGTLAALPPGEQMELRAKQGIPVPMVELRIVDDDGVEQPWDGKSQGEVHVRGPWVASGYYELPEASAESWRDAWLRTGDVGVIDPDGYLQLTDRIKDVIKSGGEWISSVALESALTSHPGVREAAVIGVSHPRWQERPLAMVVAKPGTQLSKEDVLSFLEGKVAKWWVPDDVVFLPEIPKTSVGKLDKKVLRARFADHVLPAG